MARIVRHILSAPARHMTCAGFVAITLAFALSMPRPGFAAGELRDIEVVTLPGNQVELRLKLSGPAPEPVTFTIDNPARLAIDLRDTRLALKDRSVDIGIGVVRSVSAAEAQGRTRVVVNLASVIPYQTRVQDDMLIVSLGVTPATTAASTFGPSGNQPLAAPAAVPRDKRVANIDFRRGEFGEGRVVVTLTDPATAVDVREEANRVIVDFRNAQLPPELLRRFDVMDFATPVRFIDATREGQGSRLVVTAAGRYEQLAYQSDNVFTLELKPVTEEEEEAARREKEYTGERLTLNFQDIETRAVLQIIADFTGMNIVVSDSVRGNVTLRLQNVPWDQALDIILRTKGLAMRQNGNVMLVAPAAEIAERERLELESQQQIRQLEPLRAEFIQINYAKAAEIAKLIGKGGGETSMLSERGALSVDERTNTLLVQDTESRLTDIRRLIRKLDVPVSQVLIESRIVIANDDFTRELGTRFGVNAFELNQNELISTSGSINGTTNINNGFLGGTGINLPGDDRLNVNLPVANPAGRIAFAVLGSDYLVDLELSALQAEGRGKVVSSPRVITANQREALIEQGVEIPYQESSSSGATTTQFKKAVLSLKVTPQITPDDRIIMDLEIKKDSVGQQVPSATGGFVPSIDTREVTTQVLVDNGNTVVLGGIYETEQLHTVSKVPLLGDIPLLGALFRTTRNTADKAELLVFVTPKIVKEGANLQ
ncbi:MAG TPA: type IV pilus secretin PilQ [Gammaproteobacteria bacterium]|nr:type IV pilus secretin PilQ [Gammaproteobacteria bacterium]